MDEINGFFIINEKSKRIPNVNTVFSMNWQLVLYRAGVYDPVFKIYGPLLKNTSHFSDLQARSRKYDPLSPKYEQLVEKSLSFKDSAAFMTRLNG
ncbi:hypothetical protein A6P54_07490 [Bacillus sp. MKU004]|nr:hypothetical protein A6P54_07490 [Bacillus sp. MKU004]